jgi:hypothetical protein
MPVFRYQPECKPIDLMLITIVHLCLAPLHEDYLEHHAYKGDPIMSPVTCSAIGEKAHLILMWVTTPCVGNASHPQKLGVMMINP